MKLIKQDLQEQFGNTALERYVLNDILEDSNSYSGDFIQRVKARIKDVNYGCSMGVIGKLTYNDDCKKFFIKFIEDISALVIELEEDTGSPIAYKGNIPIYVFYAWLAYEQVAYQIENFIESKSE
jgi:hypothetical protein